MSLQPITKVRDFTLSILILSRVLYFVGLVCLFEMLSIFWFSCDSHAAFNGFQVQPHTIPLDEILSGGPPRDGIPALLDPQFIDADEVEFLSPQDRVLGLSGEHHAKAYPIAILNWHEIVNDTFEGTPVVVTYCPLCGTGIGFLRQRDNQLQTFGVSGLLYQSDVLMYDHQTESLWSQIAMQAVTGPSLGDRLEPIFLEHTTWEAWRDRYPHTLVLSRQTGFTRDYSHDPYQHYAQSDSVMFTPAKLDDRLPPKEWVMGIEVQGIFKAYPFSLLEERGPAFWDSIHKKDYVVCWNGEARSAKVVDPQGKPIPTVTAYWFAWYAFHPKTEVFMEKPNHQYQTLKNAAQKC